MCKTQLLNSIMVTWGLALCYRDSRRGLGVPWPMLSLQQVLWKFTPFRRTDARLSPEVQATFWHKLREKPQGFPSPQASRTAGDDRCLSLLHLVFLLQQSRTKAEGLDLRGRGAGSPALTLAHWPKAHRLQPWPADTSPSLWSPSSSPPMKAETNTDFNLSR